MGKAKDGSECYTRQNKSGGAYVTCEGSQNKRENRRKLKAGGEPPVMTKKPKKPKADSAREKGKRRAKAKKLTTRPPGRIDTDGPRNVGIVDRSKPPKKDAPKAKSFNFNKKALEAIKPTKEFLKKFGDLEPEAVTLFNKMNKVTREPKPGELLFTNDSISELQDGTGEGFKYVKNLDSLLKLSSYNEKDFQPLSKAQKNKISKMTGDKGVVVGGIANVSKPGLAFNYMYPRKIMGDNKVRLLTKNAGPGIVFKKKKK